MNTKHTSGEWYAKDGQIYPLETGKTLCLIPYFDEDNEQHKADQTLIAAAPDLLLALGRLVDRIQICSNGLWLDKTPEYEQAMKAIEKAVIGQK